MRGRARVAQGHGRSPVLHRRRRAGPHRAVGRGRAVRPVRLAHNAHVIDSRKTFAVGDNQGAALDANNHVYRSSEQAATTWDEIGDKVLDSLGGYVTVDYDPLTVNLYADVHDSNAQVIDFGENVTGITVKTDSTSQYTALRPTGATPKDADGPLTVAGLPDG